MRHKHVGTYLGAAIQELVDADRAFESHLAFRANKADYGAKIADELERLHRPVAAARDRLLHLLAQEAISDEERQALLGDGR